MAKVLEDTLGNLEYAMLAICTVGVVLLLAKAYGVGVNVSRDGMDFAPGQATRFTVPDHTGARESKYESLTNKTKFRRGYDGMMGGNEAPVFWNNQFVDVETGARQADGLNDDGADDGSAWSVVGGKSDGMKGHNKGLDAALNGLNVASP